MLKISIVVGFYISIYLIEVSRQDTCSSSLNLGRAAISENNDNGSIVYNYTIFQNNSDILSVSILPPNDNYFYFDIKKLQLIALAVFDAESLNVYQLRLAVTCQSKNLVIFEQIVTITNLNDNQAYWVYTSSVNYYIGRIFDNSSLNTAVTFVEQPSFKDKDFPSRHGLVLFDDTFYGSLDDTTFQVTIYNKKLLDFDVKKFYNITMTLTDIDVDTGNVRFTSNTSIIIIITDTDSKPPIFENSWYTFQIYNNATNGSLFQVSPKPLKAYDGDLAINAPILYKFVSAIDYLYLDPELGILRSNIAFLKADTIQTIFMAYQKDNVDKKASVDVKIVILVPVSFYQKLVTVYFEENKVSELVMLNYTSDQNKAVILTMVPMLPRFKIFSSGQILVTQALNYDIQNFYNFTIIGNDGTTSDGMILLVYINRTSYTKPRFPQSSYYFNGDINSGLINGIVSVIISNPNSTITFEILKDYGIFKINSSNGFVFVPQEKVSTIQPTVYQIIINLYDSTPPQLADSTNVFLDFSIFIKSTTISSQNPNNVLLMIYIFIPIIILLILIFLLLLFYYKRRWSIKNKHGSMDSKFNEPRNFFDSGNSRESSKFNESSFQIHDIYSSDGLVWNLRKEFMQGNITKNERKPNERANQLENREMTERKLDYKDKSYFNKLYSDQSSGRCTEMQTTF